jgi:hypothetical protein
MGIKTLDVWVHGLNLYKILTTLETEHVGFEVGRAGLIYFFRSSKIKELREKVARRLHRYLWKTSPEMKKN